MVSLAMVAFVTTLTTPKITTRLLVCNNPISFWQEIDHSFLTAAPSGRSTLRTITTVGLT